ncbi:hypothetical protein [Actinomadura sp. GTD37]|uniref:hypothetical protein n=1 Tax=Actinomadura sp. GTD37 TaxID=1778030 RepID=UPI0035BF9F73
MDETRNGRAAERRRAPAKDVAGAAGGRAEAVSRRPGIRRWNAPGTARSAGTRRRVRLVAGAGLVVRESTGVPS